MRNIGEELKAKMAEPSPQALQTIIEACQHRFWQIDERNLHHVKPRFDCLELSLQKYHKYVHHMGEGDHYYICRLTSPLTLDDILDSCQILYTVYDYMNGVKGCLSYLNQQSQSFPWMDEYAIEDGNVIVKPKHNKELLEGVANLQNNELDDIVRMFYKHGATVTDKEAASASLCKLLEAGDTRKLLTFDLTEKQVGLIFEFANTQYIRHGKLEQRKATEHELQIFFDFGLALVRFADQINKNKNLLDK